VDRYWDSCFQGLLYDYPTYNVGKWPNQQLQSVHNMRRMLTDTSFSNSIVLYVDKNRILSAESSIYLPINLVLKIPNTSADRISMTSSILFIIQKFTLEKSKDNMGGWWRFLCLCVLLRTVCLEQNMWQTKKKWNLDHGEWESFCTSGASTWYVNEQWTILRIQDKQSFNSSVKMVPIYF
jgi:hypothetical protein